MGRDRHSGVSMAKAHRSECVHIITMDRKRADHHGAIISVARLLSSQKYIIAERDAYKRVQQYGWFEVSINIPKLPIYEAIYFDCNVLRAYHYNSSLIVHA